MPDKYLRKLNIELVDGEYENPIKEQLRDPAQVFTIFEKLKDKAQETLLALYLWEDMKPSVYSVLSVGTESETAINHKDIFGQMFTLKAKYFILIHSHPKGDPQPSDADKLAMRQLMEQAKIMDANLLDFIIVGADSYWSMFEEADGGEYALGSTQV